MLAWYRSALCNTLKGRWGDAVTFYQGMTQWGLVPGSSNVTITTCCKFPCKMQDCLKAYQQSWHERVLAELWCLLWALEGYAGSGEALQQEVWHRLVASELAEAEQQSLAQIQGA